MAGRGVCMSSPLGAMPCHLAFKTGQLPCGRARRTNGASTTILFRDLPHANKKLGSLRRRLCAVVVSASAATNGAVGTIASTSSMREGSANSTSESVTTAKAARRASRLQSALVLRKLYRNLLRAEPLLQLPSPVYQPPEENDTLLDPDQANSIDMAAATAAADTRLQERIEEAVVLIAEMELTAEELRVGLRALKSQPERYGLLFSSSSNGKKGKADANAASASEYEDTIQARVKEVYSHLMERVSREITELPFSSVSAAQLALDARNAKYRAAGLPPALESMGDGDGAPEGGYLGADARRGLGERLGEAEKAAERFLARRVQPAVARVRDTSPEVLIEGVQRSATWAAGLWGRLNGSAADGGLSAAPSDLPLPTASDGERAATVDALHGEIEELEKKLQEASKARENRLRKAGISGRARMAAELRQMDNEVAAVSRALAVRTLQLEMEFIYGCLESEAIDVLGDPSAAAAEAGSSVALALSRRGSTDEVALLAAEFRQLDAELAAMASEVESGGALYIDDVDLASLATEIPDLRSRLGVGDTTVFGGSGFSIGRLQMQTKQAVMTVLEAAGFGVRGVRLLGSDTAAAGRLFWRALLGGTLKPREVAALRRTARDVLTFIPFAIILILPLTPVGHVLIFGFIQRYFPGFFPSQFTSRRQDLMLKYEELTKQLQSAQVAAEAESDEIEFQRAAAAAVAEAQRKAAANAKLATVTVTLAVDPSSQTQTLQSSSSSGVGGGGGDVSVSKVASGGEDDEADGPAAAAVKRLQAELSAAADSSYTAEEDE